MAAPALIDSRPGGNRVTSIVTKKSSNAVLHTRTYTFNLASEVTRIVEGTVTTDYTYDNAGQLETEVKSTGYSAGYTYDGNGNRLTRTVNGVTENYSYDAGGKLTAIVGGADPRTFTYDGAGRTTGIVRSSGTTSFTYDYESRVTSISKPGMTTNSMTYNGLDTRVGMTDSTGSRTFKRAGIGVTSPVLSDGSASFTPSGENRAGVKTAYHGGLKSFDTQTNAAQAVVGQRLTDAFGNQISSSGVWKGRFAYGGPYGYQEDPDTGLRLLGHRYYDSSTGRFLTRDPIKSGDNWYVYCGSNPVTYQDATGLLEQSTGQMTQAQKDALDQMKALHGSDVSVTYDHAGKKVIVKKGNMTLEIDKNGKVTFVVTASSNDKSGKRSTTGKVSSSKGKTSVEVGVGVESGRFSAGASTTFTSDASGNSDVTMSWKGGYTIGGGSVSVGGKFGDPPGAQAGYKGKGWSGSFAVAPGSKPKGSLTFPLGKGGSVVIGVDPGKPSITYGWKQ